MGKDKSYSGVMSRKNDILKASMGIDYEAFEREGIAFDYEAMMNAVEYPLDEVSEILAQCHAKETPLIELKNLTKVVRSISEPGKGARIFVKDEASLPSGSYKVRRAALSVYHAKRMGYKGVIAATSGNYGAAVASQAAIQGLKCIIVQECYDSQGKGQPEIIEKARKCEAFGAEVMQLSVGPELFYVFLSLLEDTGYFNASLYTPYGIAGVETLGKEIMEQCKRDIGREPDVVVATNAGGGNLTGTARGMIKSGMDRCKIIGASVDLKGLHMASDKDFNRKSFTTGHTGFGIPFMIYPDRTDVPRSAARPLRYIDRYVTVSQGEVFYITEALAQVEGMERGPAGNTSLAAAFALAKEMNEDQVILVQETEYTGAGKHIAPQLSFAKQNGIDVTIGDPKDNIPGKNIILPASPELIGVKDISLDKMRQSYINQLFKLNPNLSLTDKDKMYLLEELNCSKEDLNKFLGRS